MQSYQYHQSHAIIGEDVFAHAAGLLAKHLPLQQPLLVADVNTLKAAALHQQLTDAALLCYEQPPTASLKEAESLTAYATEAKADCLIAIGSGTINDLCKYATHTLHLPYASFATAPSMNGYLSANASLLHEGHKQSFAASHPVLMLADMDILRHAPARLIASGIGDSLCRSTILRDVLLAHHLSGSPDYDEVFEALLPHEQAVITGLEQQTDIFPSLMQLLLISGAAMTQAGSSAPASEGEHMLAHLLESRFPEISKRFFHGEIIAVTTLTMATLQESLLQHPLLGFQEIENSSTLSPDMLSIYQKKQASLRCNQWHWREEPRMAQALSSNQLKHALQLAGCPTHITELGISESDYQALLPLARFTRDRLTFLDAYAILNKFY